ncbi:MAG: Fic family protein [Clostridiales Family XIII bacterium]|jgi:Fic family protein|nr:Fic family protein [Clostridiales Family XIII bacterium]
MHIHDKNNWTDFNWDSRALLAPLGETRSLQGRLFGRIQSLGFDLKEEAILLTLTADVIKSSEIEGERLNHEQVRSSIARRLGLKASGLVPSSRNIDGLVEMMLDATQNYKQPLTAERLFGWHAALFPIGYSGLSKIEAAQYRSVPMFVVSGAAGKEKVHYEAPAAARVQWEMAFFLKWLDGCDESDPILKAAIAHIWFVLIHPLQDGNGRIARAITDMLLARGDGSPERYFSMSSRILTERKQYCAAIETVSKGDGDITKWLLWFLSCMKNAVGQSEKLLEDVLAKARFWKRIEGVGLNGRQQKMIAGLMDDFRGKLTTGKWAKMMKVSHDTALRDIQDLEQRGILRTEPEGGRSTKYSLSPPPFV